ncbi:MAG: MFS transporter [candidate division Zixibacteria bacterium]|nr:MFS transporter [candidate division Zixibacteria bacterium]
MDTAQIYARRYKFFAVGAIGTFMATLDGSILNVALPTISENLHCDIHLVAWVLLSYSLTLVSLMLPFGAWTQIKGFAFAYQFGFIFFMAGSTLCALSHSIELLIIGRVVQAIGTAMFAAIGPGLASTVFPPEERGKGLGLMVMMVGAGFMVGPPLGGMMLSFLPWQSLFLVNLPVGVLGLYMTAKYFRLLERPAIHRKLPLRGAVSVAVALVTLVFGLSMLKDHLFSDWQVWVAGLISLIATAVFIHAENIPGQALIGTDIFRNKQFSVAVAAQTTHFISSSGVAVLIPFYLEKVRHLEPRQVSLYLVIVPIAMFMLAPLSGKMSDKIGPQKLTIAGMVGLVLGLYMMSRLDINTAGLYIAASLAVIGGGVGLFSTPNSSAMMGAVRPDQRAITSSILATNRNIGMSMGIALATGLFTYFQTRYAQLGDERLIFVTSYRPVIYVAVGIAMIGLILCLARPVTKPVDTAA